MVTSYDTILRSSLRKEPNRKNGSIRFSVEKEIDFFEGPISGREKVFNRIIESTVIVRILELRSL